MAALSDMANRLKNIQLNDILDDSIVATKDDLINENRDQMQHGIASDGVILGTYSPEYAKRKAKIRSSKAPYGVYDFLLNGDFQGGMFVNPLLTEIEIGSKDKKEKWIEKYARGANRVFGLTPQRLEKYSEKLKPVLIQNLRTALNI